ncbi:MAG: enoyl-CoA hydratase/isomerase family protein [Bdellovibrionaceae bacterium]|nr:enoyl-CoA hydratase/isomerase family protein [Bdellovibrionales bacterium]MCB9083820.1 enoyl-CoA hydratase/isomerase family protein [Pseudobdellovibrionaceae bacterium]
MAYNLIRVEKKQAGQVGEIVLASPPANIITAEMMKELSQALTEFQADPKCKLITIEGEGKHFSFGASVEEHKPELVNDMLPGFHKLCGQILQSPVPTLAKVKGLCLGGGFEVAMACTFVFAEEKAKFAVPEIQLAVFPPVACVLLPLKVPEAIANRIILGGEQWTSTTLDQYGLVNQVAGDGGMDEMVAKFFETEFAKKSPQSLRIAHQASRFVVTDHYNRYIGALEKLYLKDLMSTEDAKEGIQAFLDKREPQWKDAH